jgi:hypothetical protein
MARNKSIVEVGALEGSDSPRDSSRVMDPTLKTLPGGFHGLWPQLGGLR